MGTPDPLTCALFIMTAFILTGVFHTLWLRSHLSSSLAIPLDGGRTFLGKRIFGDNKTLRGFVVLVPAAGATFFGLAHLPWFEQGLWFLSPGEYGALGLLAGAGFMAGELPNSFLKRQLGIPPGEAPTNRVAKSLFFVLDRLDSIIGMLLVVSLTVPTPWQTWAYVIVIGSLIHWSFSALLFLVGVKARSA